MGPGTILMILESSLLFKWGASKVHLCSLETYGAPANSKRNNAVSIEVCTGSFDATFDAFNAFNGTVTGLMFRTGTL